MSLIYRTTMLFLYVGAALLPSELSAQTISLESIDPILQEKVKYRTGLPAQLTSVKLLLIDYKLLDRKTDLSSIEPSIERRSHINCTDNEETTTFTISNTVTLSRSITLTKGLTSQFGVSVGFDSQKTGFKTGSTASITMNTSLQTAYKADEQDTRTEVFSRKVGPMKALYVTFERSKSKEYATFEATVIATGTANAFRPRSQRVCGGKMVLGQCVAMGGSPGWMDIQLTDTLPHKLEDIIPATERQFLVSGRVEEINALNQNVISRWEDVESKNSAACKEPQRID